MMMVMRLPSLLAGLLTVAVLLTGCDSSQQGQVAGQLVKFEVAKRVAAPPVSGQLLDGGSFDLAGSKGKVVLINFWASWCAPCRLEAKDLEAVHQAMPDVQFLGINSYDDRDKALAFIEERNTYPSLLDPSSRIALGFTQVPPNALPATLILDREGRIAVVIRRVVQQEELKQLLSEVVAEAAA